MAARAKGLTVKGYRFGKRVHSQAKVEMERLQKQRQDERLRKARRDLRRLKQNKKELRTLAKVASLKEELRKKQPRRSNPFEVRF